MFAIARTFSGMPPSEYAPCTATRSAPHQHLHALDGLDDRDAQAAPAEHDARSRRSLPSASLCLRPEKIRISDGRHR